MAGNTEDDFDVTKVNATFNVLYHITEKGVQAGSILGTFISIPIAAFLHKRSGGSLNAHFIPRAQRALVRTATFTTVGSCLSGVGLLGLKEGWDKEKIEDRAYRLHYNESQNRVDRFSEYGAAGGTAAAFLAGSRGLHGVLSGSLLGAASGTIMHVITSKSESGRQIQSAKESAEKIAEELKR